MHTLLFCMIEGVNLKVLLSRDELLQLSAVQCVEEVLCHHMDYGKVLLMADIAGKLLEPFYTLHFATLKQSSCSRPYPAKTSSLSGEEGWSSVTNSILTSVQFPVLLSEFSGHC